MALRPMSFDQTSEYYPKYNDYIELNGGQSMGDYTDAKLYQLLVNDSNILPRRFCYFLVQATGGLRTGRCFLYEQSKNYGWVEVYHFYVSPRFLRINDGTPNLMQWATS